MNDTLEHRTEIMVQGYRSSCMAQFGAKLSDGTVHVVTVETPFGGEQGRAHTMREAIRVSQRMMERGLAEGLACGHEKTTKVSANQIDAGKAKQRR